MPSVTSEIFLIFLLVFVNALFSMAEFAFISMRKERLQKAADQGNRRARRAVALAQNLDQVLYVVQIGVTLIGIFAGVVAGASIANVLAQGLSNIAVLRPYAPSLALFLVGIVTTYCTLVFGELLPKRIALTNPERIAVLLAGLMQALSKFMRPAIWILSKSTDFVLRIVGVRAKERPSVTEDEIRALLQEGTEAGVIKEVERDMVESVFLLNDRLASSLMTPRHDVVWLDVEDPPEELKRKIIASPFSRFPVGREGFDEVLGEVHAKDFLVQAWAGEPFDIEKVLRKPLFVPAIMPALKVLEEFRKSGTQMAIVIDEYGNVEGIVTLTDILEAIVGDIPASDQPEEPQVVLRENGTWLVDGMLPTEEFCRTFGLESLPGEEQGLFQTIAGFVVMQLGHIPSVADSFEWGNMRFEVIDMDGPRVDKILVSFLSQESPSSAERGTPDGEDFAEDSIKGE